MRERKIADREPWITDRTAGALPVFCCLLLACLTLSFCAGCAGTSVQTTLRTNYGKFTYDSKGATDAK